MKKLLNMNSTVSVRVTAVGEEILENYRKKLSTFFRQGQDFGDLYKTKNGILTEQLWKIMGLFGEHTSNGFNNPMQNAIQLDEDDLIEGEL